ncbi:hypothetical protein AVEN_145216-1 [Araneus ventricosus]|uniref:Uncharacterized protein n=1 Tax=Araneus ventricosus TaxID=182803 RepID=A0A4Y2BUU5_ARAVE|nr:hypothetical protein AVEN_145216-1 [Araneus ventricosus]
MSSSSAKCCVQDVVLVDQTDENRLGLSLVVSAIASTLQPRLSPKRFSSDDDDVQHNVLLWMRQQPKEFYATGIGTLIKRWDKCINIGGDYVEK